MGLDAPNWFVLQLGTRCQILYGLILHGNFPAVFSRLMERSVLETCQGAPLCRNPGCRNVQEPKRQKIRWNLPLDPT